MKTLKTLEIVVPFVMCVIAWTASMSLWYGLVIGTLSGIGLYLTCKNKGHIVVRILYVIGMVMSYTMGLMVVFIR